MRIAAEPELSMKLVRKKPPTFETLRLEGDFEQVRGALLDPRFSDQLNQPLTFWALPTDRRLPLAFLGWPLGQLLETPFDQIMATPGVGTKKMVSLLDLLSRVMQSTESHDDSHDKKMTSRLPTNGSDPSDDTNTSSVSNCVSGTHWAEWCETIKRNQLAHLPLGRVAPSLQDLPTVLWETPLSFYVGRSLEEIRSLKGHGEKRVRAILKVFAVAQSALVGLSVQENVYVQLVPKFVRGLEVWFAEELSREESPSLESLQNLLCKPLVSQISLDLGETVGQIVLERLGVDGPSQSVRSQAKRLNLTRARIYQMLEDCSIAMRVRWPEGEWLLAALEPKMVKLEKDDPRVTVYYSLADLLYPRSAEAARSRWG